MTIAIADAPRHFLYRPGLLTPDDAQRLTSKALGYCDDGELYLQYGVSESFSFDDGRLKNASYDNQSGFGLRGLSGESTGFAHASEISAEAIQRAGETLRLLDPTKISPPSAPSRTNRHLYTDANPLTLKPFSEKVALCQKIDAAARARDPHVCQVSVGLSASWSVIEIIRADGFIAQDIRPLVRLNISVVVEKNGRRESGFYGLGGRYLYDPIFEEASWQRGIDMALASALVNLEAVPAPVGEMPVVLGPGWPGVLLHEAVGHGLEGDFNRKGSSVFSGRIGEKVAADGVTVIDDGSIADRRGSLSIDDEGTPTSRTVLIENGILKSYMQDRLNARLMGMAPTGNGRRESYVHAPMPRMTNTFMAAGQEDPAEIMSRVKKGIFAKNFGGGQVDITSGKFVFSCTEAYFIENGRIGAPIKGATLIGDGPTVLNKIAAIGNDLALDEGVGICGKGGQSVPAGVGQPSLLVEGLTVGGTAT
ncbi:MAG: metalloprotease TldD [Zymomonas mobilis subsp. pomaceae]|uniref:Peptidase U62 modulator of DNA gyrase n=1 Tax=Zymomonas mobilis subsp. pomaceae (strain ATCC 29192 / DSM 22645 / JCM 10191 / CCUG 17912 / NBRC 13757 / NCIMB 11200 / NRRL B-4491 / Barker I) TaxID=579138 RepID=F8ESH8_ZYMMT|nr:metalloprotease TldD [Zymomonas mobilis]AEI37753.1 peptidase U62 modulator of DNA gyrase [Zymomonas mobilis subsp. pomaceae ATCC 29192]MDX5949120.1 metalloprotease TldD [Zymomonas mobilis subsp. pomaceae]GEB88927.1 peptidase C69 [Zymomonas mobilis subsp. pomaceae]